MTSVICRRGSAGMCFCRVVPVILSRVNLNGLYVGVINTMNHGFSIYITKKF